MRFPSLATSLTVAVIARQTAGLDLLHALSNVFDDGRKSIEKAASDISNWDSEHDIPVLLDEGRETLDGIAEDLWTDLISSVGKVGIALFDFYNLHPDLVLAVGAVLTESFLPSLVEKLGLLEIFEIERALPILQAIGFGKNGVVKGSVAAWIQRMLYSYGIPKDGLFSWLQSIAMGHSHQILVKAKL